MTRDMLETILGEAPGAKLDTGKPEGTASKPDKKSDKGSARPPSQQTDDRSYSFAEEHRVSLYLSLGDAGTVVNEIVRLGLGAVLRVEQKDRTVLFVDYASVQGLSVRPPRTVGESPRTGF